MNEGELLLDLGRLRRLDAEAAEEIEFEYPQTLAYLRGAGPWTETFELAPALRELEAALTDGLVSSDTIGRLPPERR